MKAMFIMCHHNKTLYENCFLYPWVILIILEYLHGMEKILYGIKQVELLFVSSA